MLKPKLIFLDFDGVLNHENWYRARKLLEEQYPLSEIDPANVLQLNRIINECGGPEIVKVVVSSTWRMGRTAEQLQELLTAKGFIGQVIGLTPHFYGSFINEGKKESFSVPRGCEIEYIVTHEFKFQRINWSREQQFNYMEKSLIDNYIILDDDSDMLYGQREHYIKCNAYKNGLDADTADKAIKALNTDIVALYYTQQDND